jgi:tRNA nucleotidyltransferase (CCA-adding enzyme)
MSPGTRAGAIDPAVAGPAVLEDVRELPGGPQLLEAVADRDDAELVGGATRDLLLERTPLELDVVVERDAEKLARRLAALLTAADLAPTRELRQGGHERFGTAFVTWPGGRIDIATRRAESYPAPGALPRVRPGDLEQDLLRRDFTVNAIAVALSGARAGAMAAPATALDDLQAHALRVLHERSFIDDPTRLLRLGRYRARLGFDVEPQTASLAGQALREGALQTVSGARVGAELRLALGEGDAIASLSSLAELGVLRSLRPPLSFDEQLARQALELLPAQDGRADALLLAVLLLRGSHDGADDQLALAVSLDAWEFPAGDRDRALAAAQRAPALTRALQAAGSRSQEREALRGAPLEALALAGALAQREGAQQAERAARAWLAELRHVRLAVTGDDLLAAGVTPGPEVGRRLAQLLDMRLDGTVGDSREAQLQAALQERP